MEFEGGALGRPLFFMFMDQMSLPVVVHKGEPIAVVVKTIPKDVPVTGVLLDQSAQSEALANESTSRNISFPDESRFKELVKEQETRLTKGNQNCLRPIAVESHETGSVHIGFSVAPYAETAAANTLFKQLPLTSRVKAMATSRLGTPIDYSRNLGVAAVLITSDRKFVLAHRTNKVNLQDIGTLALIAETALEKQLKGKTDLDFREVMAEGFQKELGIPRAALVDANGNLQIDFTHLISQVPTGGLALIGVARTSMSADEVLKTHLNAPDRSEADPAVFDWDENGVTQVLTGQAKLACWAPSALIGAIERDAEMGKEVADRAASVAQFQIHTNVPSVEQTSSSVGIGLNL